MQNFFTLHFSSFVLDQEAPITEVPETKSD